MVRQIWHLFTRLRNREAFEDELDAEIREYFETIVDRGVTRGLSPEEARRVARLQFGSPEQVKEKVRDARMGTTFELAISEIAYTLRTLRKSPGFALLSILTLALGIGAGTAIFTIVDSVLLKPLAYRNSSDLVVAWESLRFLPGGPVGPNPRHADVWQKRSTAFSGIALLRLGAQGLSVGSEHPRIAGQLRRSPRSLKCFRSRHCSAARSARMTVYLDTTKSSS
jgi:hypothetical protein